MGWVLMSERDLNRLEVLAQIDDGRLSVGNGANMLGLVIIPLTHQPPDLVVA
jgi:hypothetical protein